MTRRINIHLYVSAHMGMRAIGEFYCQLSNDIESDHLLCKHFIGLILNPHFQLSSREEIIKMKNFASVVEIEGWEDVCMRDNPK